jgi:histidinol-phosphate/aromatic aminotransferase/cobyric acid decarboxylase-like protein
VATPTLAVLPELLELADLAGFAASIASARAELVAVLADRGLVARPSDANFVLVDGAAGVRDRLARRGVVVRDGASFGLPDAVRIAVPDPAGLERLAQALDAALAGAR